MANIINMELDTWEGSARDNLIAPDISRLVHCGMSDISDQKKYILNNFITNIKFSAALKNESRRIIFNFIRKTEICFNEYCYARNHLIEYIKTKNEMVTPYFQSIAHLENCLMHLYQAAMLFNGIIGEKQFQTNDGSVLDRVNKVYNQIKYIESYAHGSQTGGASSFEMFIKYQNERSSLEREEIGDLSTTALWITNSGIECKMAEISFTELAAQITGYYEEAEKIATYDVAKHNAPSGVL